MTSERRRGTVGMRLVGMSLAVVAGCGVATTATPPPFEMGSPFRYVAEGDPHAQHGPAYSLRITEPKEGARYGQDVEVDVLCEVIVPEGGATPSALSLELLGGKNMIFDSVHPRPKEKQGEGTYLFAGRLTTPRRPGAFKIVAEGSDTVWLRPVSPAAVEIPVEKRVSTRRIPSPPVTVRVK